MRGTKLILAFIFLLLVSCSPSRRDAESSRKPVLAVSIDAQRKMLEAIAGPDYEIITVMPAGANPETFEPTVSQRMKTSNAIAYFPIGYFPFEKAVEKEMQGKLVVDVSSQIEPIMDTHSHGNHQHSIVDPHIWSSFKNAGIMAEEMCKAMIKIDEKNADIYIHRRDSIQKEYALNDSILNTILSQSNSFAVWHPSLSYFARDYNLNQISVGQESKEATPSHLANVIKKAKDAEVKILFFQKEYDSRQAMILNNEIGSRIVEINPLDYDWDVQLINIANEIASGNDASGKN